MLKSYFFNCAKTFFAESDSTTMAPASMAVSLITSLPAPVNRGKPCSPLPKSGTQTSGVVTRNESVPNVMMIANPAPASPILEENIPKNVSMPIP